MGLLDKAKDAADTARAKVSEKVEQTTSADAGNDTNGPAAEAPSAPAGSPPAPEPGGEPRGARVVGDAELDEEMSGPQSQLSHAESPGGTTPGAPKPEGETPGGPAPGSSH